jgi:membrane protein required for colicin V production
MNYLDIIIAVPLLYALIKGFSNGLIKEVTSLLALFIGVYFAVNFSEFLEPKFIHILDSYHEFSSVLAFGVLFLASTLCVKALGFFVDKLTKALALGVFSRIFGGVFGFFKVVVIFSFLLFVINDYNLVNKQTRDSSVLLEPLTNIAKIITPQLKKHKYFLETMDKETKKAKEKVKEKINPE